MYDDQFALVPNALADAYFLKNITTAKAHFLRFSERRALPPDPSSLNCTLGLGLGAWPEGIMTHKVFLLGGRLKALQLDARLMHVPEALLVPDAADGKVFRC